MTPRHTAARRARAMRHALRHRRHPLLRGTALITLAGMSFAVAGIATAYLRLGGFVDTHDTSALIHDMPASLADEVPDPTDPDAGRALNLVVIGSDVRDGENALLGGEEDGMRSDSTLVVHVSADRARMDVVSIPRDSRVQIPSCLYYDGSSSRTQSARFNAAFSIGAANQDIGEAAACTVNTVQSLTGIPIDGWVVVDFAGFRNMVDALGGVQMCIPTEMHSAKAGLDLMPGNQRLDGYTALAYARARTGTGLGNGSDLMRLGRQQQLLGSIAQEVFAKDLLTDSAALYRFLTSALQSIAADPDTGNLNNLAGLAWSLRAIPPGNITFMTVPYAANPNDANEVIWTAEATSIWTNLAADVPMVAPAAPAAPSDATAGSATGGSATGGSATAGSTTAGSTTAQETAEPPAPGIDAFTPADIPAICGG